MKCPACGAEADRSFCPACGRRLRSWPFDRPALAWIATGTIVMALAAVLLLRMTALPPASGPAAAGGAEGGPGPMATTDITAMTPREQADRLFNRIMAAAERRDTAQIAFFAPMAVRAYDAIGPLDLDARYHLGMIELIQGNSRIARAQADSMARAVPGHLLASLLRAEIARMENDPATRDRAWRDFLRNFDSEFAAGRPEYGDHRGALEAAREEARKAVGSGS